ncbi:MAG: hypothetical protein ACOY0T_20630 [Myxococcota bacterium]
MKVLWLAGCGGNAESSTSCGEVQPCGGNPIGTWKIAESCLDDKALADELLESLQMFGCSSASVQSAHLKTTGNASYNADQSFTTSTSSTFDATLLIPSSCITRAGFTLTCDQLTSALAQLMSDEIGNLTCSTTSGGCNCKVVTPPRTLMESGTYSVSGTRLVQTSSNGSSADAEFCVQGSELHMIALDTSNLDTMGRPKIVADIVAIKQ